MREDSSLEGSFDLTTMRLQFILWIYDLTSPSRGLILNVFILAWGLIMASSCSKSLGTVDPQLFRHSCTSPPPPPQNQGDLSTPIPRSSFPSEKKKNRVVSNLLKLWNLLFLNMTCIKKYRKRKCWEMKRGNSRKSWEMRKISVATCEVPLDQLSTAQLELKRLSRKKPKRGKLSRFTEFKNQNWKVQNYFLPP